jgi:phage/plasmid-like protein (TIGR03299 family)
MSHELTKNAIGEAEFFFAGKKPWHGLGQGVEGLQKAEDAIKLAHLDWFVSKRPLLTMDGIAVPEKIGMATVRDDNNTVLGCVTEQYSVVQNSDAFSFFDCVVGSGEALYETAGSLFGGKKVFITSQIPGDIHLTADDTVEKYLVLLNPHDGTGSLKMFFTPIRVVCKNTLNAAIRSKGRDYALSQGISIRHIGDIDTKIKQARDILGITSRYFQSFEEVATAMKNKLVNSAMVEDFIKKCFEVQPIEDISTRKQNEMDRVRELFESDPKNNLPGIEGTLWSLYNGAVEFADHEAVAVRKCPDRRMQSILWGSGESFKNRAFEASISLINR